LVAALADSAEHATEAADLLRDVGTGSAHEPEYVQAAASLTSVVEGVDHLLGVLQALTARFSRYLADKSPPVDAEPAWAEQQRDKLPTYVTSGQYFDEDGHSDIVQSGRQDGDEHLRIGELLRELGAFTRPRGTPLMIEHVEAKVAWRMRNGRSGKVLLIINNPMCVGPESCIEYLEDILLPGQVLTVDDPERRRVFRGRNE